jgi:outer membrane protein TolC
MKFVFLTIVTTVLLVLSGCQTYSAQPLPDKSDLATALPVPGAVLDMNEVATIAVLNNPTLKAARAKAQVSAAQAFAAGLLPNPQFTASLDQPSDKGLGLTNAYGLGLALDLQALLTQPAKTASANSARDQAQLELLWQEWQTVAEVRTLYVQRLTEANKREFFTAAEEKYALQTARSERALQAGDVTLDQAGGDVAVLADVRSRRSIAERSALQADQSLHSLLGVAPDVSMSLQALTAPDVPDWPVVEAAINKLANSRPDLRALQAGYQSQEKQLLKAVLSQFPTISVVFGKARDISNVHTTTLGVTLTLPLFDHGQGDIAIQRATRAQLRAEYQARLDQATGDVWRLWTETQQLKTQLQTIEARLPPLQTAVDHAEQAYEARDMTVTAYLTMLNTLLSSRSELFDLRASLWSDVIALSTVLGTQIEPVTSNKQDNVL